MPVPECIRKPRITRLGYHVVVISRGRKKHHSLLVHRAVALAFVPNPDGKRFVNHKDGNKSNNHFSNLEWCTHGENIRHAVATGLHRAPKGEQHHRSKLTDDDVRWIRVWLQEGFPQRKIASVFSVPQATICLIKAGRAWAHVV